MTFSSLLGEMLQWALPLNALGALIHCISKCVPVLSHQDPGRGRIDQEAASGTSNIVHIFRLWWYATGMF